MGKRKEIADSEEEQAVTTESEEEKPKKTKQKAKQTISVKRPQFKSVEDDSDDEEEEEERPLKKKRGEKSSSPKKSAKDADTEPGALLVDESGDKYIELGKKRRATVRAFKGTVFLDIREFYESGGEARPGKKGISLSAEQWAILKDNADLVDIMFRKAKK